MYPNGYNLIPSFEYTDEENTIISPNINVCPILNTIQTNMINSQEWINHYNNITEPLNEQVSKFMYNSLSNDGLAQDCATVYLCHNKQIPNKYTHELLNNINNDLMWQQNYTHYYPNYVNASKYNNGPLLYLIYQRLINSVERFHIYFIAFHS